MILWFEWNTNEIWLLAGKGLRFLRVFQQTQTLSQAVSRNHGKSRLVAMVKQSFSKDAVAAVQTLITLRPGSWNSISQIIGATGFGSSDSLTSRVGIPLTWTSSGRVYPLLSQCC